MRGNGFVFLVVFVKDVQLAHPVIKGYGTNNYEEPINGVCSPPIFHKPEKVVGGKKKIYK